MTSDKSKLLIGEMNKSEIFKSRKMKFDKPFLPPRKKSEHAKKLNTLLEKASEKAEKLADKKVESASKSLFAVKVHPQTLPPVDAYGSARDKVRVIYENKETHTVLLESEKPKLSALEKKIGEYANKLTPKTKEPAHNEAIAAITSVHVATFNVVKGPNLKALEPTLDAEAEDWFEISCRGGKYVDQSEKTNSLKQIDEALDFLKKEKQEIVFYEAAEKIIVYLKVSLKNLEKIFLATDCIFEVDYIPKQTFNWLLLDKSDEMSHPDINTTAPAASSATVVVLDSGTNSKHPALSACISFEGSVHPEDSSPVDEDGHGTMMCGTGLHGQEISTHIRSGTAPQGSHWIESVRLYKEGSQTNGNPRNRALWAVLTKKAIELSDQNGRKDNRKVFALAITNPLPVAGSTTSWSLAVDEMVYNSGQGRLLFVSGGNYDPFNIQVAQNFPGENLIQKLHDPAQAVNAVTVSGFTNFITLPPDNAYKDYQVLSGVGGISPHNLSGKTAESGEPIKPDVVFEAGNGAFDTMMMITDLPTLNEISTSHDLSRKYDRFYGTSLATALASNFAARLWNEYPKFRPETIRALMVHSSSWTPEMIRQASGKDDLLALCGYGTPDYSFASECVNTRASIVIEDSISNGSVVKKIEHKDGKKITKTVLERDMKSFTLPIPEEELLQLGDREVELRVTLSYFSEPNYMGGNKYRGMDLLWDIQGPFEPREDFLKRINEAKRVQGDKTSKGFEGWDIGPMRRRRGTVQGDRWKGPASSLAGDKLIAVYPKYGWWNERKEFKERVTNFSLLVTIVVPGIDVLSYVQNRLKVPNEVLVPSGRSR